MLPRCVEGDATSSTLARYAVPVALYVATIEVRASPERAFAVLVDPARFPQWQALAVRAFEQSGPLSQVGSSVRIDHGPRMVRRMTILESDPPLRLRYRQEGMGFEDTTEVLIEPAGGSTRITMRLELRVAGGAVGRLLERVSRRQSGRELQAELERFGEVVDRPGPPVRPPGSLLTAESGAGLRIVKVLAQDDDAIHLALLPGVAPTRDTDPRPFLDADSRLADPIHLQPLQVPVRRLAARIIRGQPVLRLDGGVGVPHIALAPDAFVDALPEPTGLEIVVREDELTEVGSWRAANGPLLGRDVDTGVSPLLTVRLADGYGIVKLLNVDRRGVHIRLYADRWSIPPDDVDPWRLALARQSDGRFGVGHMPMTVAAFSAMDPMFERLAMIGPDELGGYRTWLADGGGYFA